MITRSRADCKIIKKPKSELVDDSLIHNGTEPAENQQESCQQGQTQPSTTLDDSMQLLNPSTESVEPFIENTIVTVDVVESDSSESESESNEVLNEDSAVGARTDPAPASAAPSSSVPCSSRAAYSKADLASMDMMELVKLLDSGDIEMDELVEACDEAAAKRKEEAKRNRDLRDPQVLMSAIKEEIADADTWSALRAESGRLRRGQVSAAEYYARFADAFAALDGEGLLEPLVDSLPDPAKRHEIRELHRLRAGR